MKLYQTQSILFILLVSAMLLLSCKKVIHIDFKDAGQQLVVEGNVTNSGSMQTVKLSKTVAITDVSNFPTVSGATVTISSDGNVYPLQETVAGTYVTNSLKGQPTKTYQLNITADGQTYTATSTMPSQVKLDSLGLDVTSIVGKEFQSIIVYYTDPAAVTNYYRFVLTVNNVASNNYFVYNDELTNGRTVNHSLRDNDLNLVKGDHAAVEMQCIDKNIYQYLTGLDQNENRGAASTTPANPTSNVSNGALGYFSAHTVQDATITIK
ncbi:MAG: DUF4249 domain-containing protein [Janthinobacterium lividum]